jgi:RNA polymerase sigma factor (sigma-70 family)
MPAKQFPFLIRRLHRYVGRPASGVLDAELLERFVNQRDEAAFELLVWRHERMVFGLCQRILRRHQDAEDAFQATFLALACKAGSIGKRQALASWLHKVAYRIALRARANSAKRTHHERQAVVNTGRSDANAEADTGVDGLAYRLLHEEVNRLPEKYRAPVVLCYFEGRTNEEAARQLRCPTGTVVTWLARARKRLRSRLEHRGLAPAIGLMALGRWPGSDALAAAPDSLRELTVRAALVFAIDHTATSLVSARVSALAQGVLKSMMMTKLKLIAAMVLCIGLVGTGSGVLAFRNTCTESLINLPETPAGLGALKATGPQVENPLATDDVEPRDDQSKKPAAKQKDRNKDITAKDVVTQSFKTKQAPRIVVELYNGAIEVDANAEGGVDARVTKEGRGQTEEAAKEALKAVDLRMTQEGDTVRIRATRTDEKDTKHNSGVSAVLKVPPGATLDLQTRNGAVVVNGGTSPVQVATSNGSIQTKNSKGTLDLSTSNGAITVTGATSQVKVKTTNGPVTIKSERSLVTAQTSNGAVHFQGALGAGVNSLRTSNGSITVSLPADTRFHLDAETSHGRITSDFKGEKVAGRKLRLSTTVGRDPAITLQLHTSNGGISIRRQDAK